MSRVIALLVVVVLAACKSIPVYQGKAILRINAEPQGARVYEMPGKYMGITPLDVAFDVGEDDRRRGTITTREFVIVGDGCKPAKTQYRLEVRSDVIATLEMQELNMPDVLYNGVLTYHELALLERDPSASLQRAPEVQRLDVRHQDSTLGEAVKAGQLITILRSLKGL